MKLYISKLYIWFDKGVKPRIITFENNKVLTSSLFCATI